MGTQTERSEQDILNSIFDGSRLHFVAANTALNNDAYYTEQQVVNLAFNEVTNELKGV